MGRRPARRYPTIPISTHRLDPRRHPGRRGAANSVKRVTQELGGKSANIILPDADLGKTIPAGVLRCFTDTDQ
jgi:hypothetical protein